MIYVGYNKKRFLIKQILNIPIEIYVDLHIQKAVNCPEKLAFR